MTDYEKLIKMIDELNPGECLVLYQSEDRHRWFEVKDVSEAVVEEASDQGMSAVTSRKLLIPLVTS